MIYKLKACVMKMLKRIHEPKRQNQQHLINYYQADYINHSFHKYCKS
jgi:hypothetical protein